MKKVFIVILLMFVGYQSSFSNSVKEISSNVNQMVDPGTWSYTQDGNYLYISYESGCTLLTWTYYRYPGEMGYNRIRINRTHICGDYTFPVTEEPPTSGTESSLISWTDQQNLSIAQ